VTTLKKLIETEAELTVGYSCCYWQWHQFLPSYLFNPLYRLLCCSLSTFFRDNTCI